MRALAAMVEGLLRVEGVDPLDMPRSVEIPVRIPLDVRRDGVRAASDAMQQILKRIQEVRSHERALVPGAVYCYFQDTAQAQHCRPEQPREVFDGYASTGRPVFTDFVTMAIERKDPLLDRLLAGDDVILTHVTMGRVLRTQQLQEFGKTSPVYRILGQVDAGLFPLLNDERKAAFSFQLLRGTTLEGKPRLRLHTVGAVDLLDVADPEVANLVYRFQRRLDAESLRLAGLHKSGTEALDEEEFVLPLLKDLAQALSGYSRRAGRRTQHAVERSDQGVRPTAKAYEDAEQAGDLDLLQDDVEGTVVVVGPKGRVHVFTTDAKHVTSLNMQGSAVAKRRQQGRWRPAEPEERGEFRLQLKRRRSAGEDTVAEATPDASAE
ncbi:MAG: hypothetical protein IT458_19700 [Planctomycetes bacterium]|nr:hypothetical protein [Planctomycetota bacterium]